MQSPLARLHGLLMIFLATANAQVWHFDPSIKFSGKITGNYGVINCGPDDNSKVIELLTSLKSALQPALTNLLLPVSSPAYTVFFKDVNRATFVRDILQNVADGTPVPPLSGHGIAAQTPLMFCTTGGNQATYITAAGIRVDTYTFCVDHDRVSAYIWRGQSITVLCPKFFKNPAIPVRSPKSCLTVDPHFNVFRNDMMGFSDYQLWILLHELVHYYTHAIGDSGQDLELEGSGLANYCAMLPARMAVNHAYSYVYFVADVWLGCTEFPKVNSEPQRRVGGIELLEVDPNGNSSVPVAQNLSGHDGRLLAGANSTLPFWAK